MYKTMLTCCASGAVLVIALTACSNSAAPAAASGTPAATHATSASAAAATTPPASSSAPAAPPSITPSEAASGSATPSAPTASSNPLVGTWQVDYGDPTIVYITESGGTYTISVGPEGTEPVGMGCNLPPGTKIATFSATGPDTYSGQQGTWTSDSNSVNCSFKAWAKTPFKLTQDPYTLAMPSTDSNDPLPVTFHKI